MKVILTEQQTKDLIGNLSGGLGDIDIEKEAPNLAKAIKSFTNPASMLGGDEKGGVLSKIKGKFAPKIPEGDEMMHPLGHTAPISSDFGHRNVSVGSSNHKGVDISTPSGSPVYAPLDGVVVSSRDTTPNACGGFVQLSHANVKTKFCHLKKMTVQQGEKVKKGQIIGYSGGGSKDPMRGTSTGSHLHYEILGRGDIAMNPTSYQQNLA
jgi:murein DD-endopeptidase MepM/ murein hydrolase activator NlpD